MRNQTRNEMAAALLLMASTIQELSEKVDNLTSMHEAVLDEVTPMGLDISKMLKIVTSELGDCDSL